MYWKLYLPFLGRTKFDHNKYNLKSVKYLKCEHLAPISLFRVRFTHDFLSKLFDHFIKININVSLLNSDNFVWSYVQLPFDRPPL